MNQINNVTIIGSGIMGAGIAQAIFKHGFQIKLYDANPAVAVNACNEIKNKARRKMDPDKISAASSLEEAVKNADLIIEAVIEDLTLKCQVFKELGKLAPSDTIFASNTSSLSISRMAEASGRPEQFLGLHFFNPALIMRLVEIIIPENLNMDILETIKTFIKTIKKKGIQCKESPGFVVNRLLIPLVNEVFYLLEEKSRNSQEDLINTALDIDSAIVTEEILLIGIFNLADLIGIDTIYKVSRIIHEGLNNNPAYKPSELLKKYFDQGYYGRKSQRGVYHYKNKISDPDLNPPLDINSNKINFIKKPKFKVINFIAVIVNEALRILETGIVNSYQDIEISMELGARWPSGPFQLAKELEMDRIYKTITKLYNSTGKNPRYEPSSLFKNLPAELENFLSDS